MHRTLVADQHRNPAVFHRNTEHPQKYQVLGASVPGWRQMPDAIVLARAVNRAKWCLVPFLILMYMLAYLDRREYWLRQAGFSGGNGGERSRVRFRRGSFFPDL